MDEKRRNNVNHRTVVDFNDVTNAIGQYGLYCIDNGVYKIIRKLLADRGLWRTTYSTSISNDFYTVPDASQFLVVCNAISEFLGANEMSCDLLGGLQGIESAIRGIRPCISTANESVFDGERWSRGGPVGHNPTSYGQPGDEFGSIAEYDTSKCEKSAWLVDGLIRATRNVGTISLLEAMAGTVALGAIGIAFMSAPPVAALTVLALAVGLSFGLSEVMNNIADYVADRRQSLICTVYNSGDAEEAYDGIKLLIDEAIAAVGVTLGASEIVLVILAFVDVDTVSQIFGSMAGLTPEQDANCSGCQVYSITAGVENEPALFDVGSVCHPTLGCGLAYIGVNFSVPVTIHSITVLSGDWGGQTNAYQYYNPGWHGENSFSSQSGVLALELVANPYSDFRLSISWSID